MCQDMEALRSAGAVEELHVVDWFSKYDRHPKANNYRRLDAYLESTLRQLRRQVTSRTGLIQVSHNKRLRVAICMIACSSIRVTTVLNNLFTSARCTWLHMQYCHIADSVTVSMLASPSGDLHQTCLYPFASAGPSFY